MNIISDLDWLEETSVSYPGFENWVETDARQNVPDFANSFLKRGIDIVTSLVLGILFLPLILLTALLVRLDSPGPVLYKQERMGKDGRKIMVYKFRSMQVNADDVLEDYLAKNPRARSEWDQTQKLRHDPRITRVGKWIRAFSVDEMPQLFNILKGDMSLVGPRPIMLGQKNLYGRGIESYCRVRPGLTGLWQVSGRNRTPFYQRTLFDVYYVRNWSIWLDISILVRTVWVVLSRDGAY